MKTLPLLLASALLSSSAPAATVLGITDIMFSGYSSEGPTEDFSFVTFVTIDSGTQIRFSDRPWTGSAFDTSNAAADGEVIWSAGGTLAAGSVVVIHLDGLNGAVASVSAGSATGGFGTASGLSTGGEILFAYQGTTASPTFIHALNYRGIYDTPTAGDTLDSLLPASLGLADADVVFPAPPSPAPKVENADFTARGSQPSFAAYKTALSNPANWTTSNDDLTLSTAPFTTVPEPAGFALFGGILGLQALRRRRRH